MLILLAGLLLFLGTHSVRIFADDWRTRQMARMGEAPWKAAYSVVSVIGLALIVWGYDAARADPSALWDPPAWTRHLASMLTLPAFVMVAAAYVPGTRIKAAVGHPMLIGVKLWALGHLLANTRLSDLLLFGAFMLWAVLDFSAARRRDRVEGRAHGAAPGWARDATAVTVGVAFWAVFALHLHVWLVGVRPLA